MKPPAPRPCASCPYRRDVPSGIWDAGEYEKLSAYDNDLPFQPMGVFLCHQQDGRVCAGWAGCHDMDHSLAVRLATSMGHMPIETAQALVSYETEVPLFSTGREAAEHGLERVNDPDLVARRMADLLTRKQARKKSDAP